MFVVKLQNTALSALAPVAMCPLSSLRRRRRRRRRDQDSKLLNQMVLCRRGQLVNRVNLPIRQDPKIMDVQYVLVMS